ncbi:hypothetical protein DRQ36_10100 [bacterium]|nr:MAG: hypothetical protein DRQ36_10100 [bacterium]
MLRFANHSAFYLFIGIPLLILFFLWAERSKTALFKKFGELELVRKLAYTKSRGLTIVRRTLLVFGFIFLILAVARPQMGTKLEEVKREGIDLVVAVDVSRSMLAEDVAPNRIAKAKHELKTLIERLRGDRIGIVAFAGDAFLVCPLTTDYGAALMIMDAVDVGVIPEQGTAIARAIEIGREAFVEKSNRQHVMLILTDGEDHEGDPVAAAEAAREKGIIIYTVGIGSPTGVPVPQYDKYGNKAGLLKDREGNIVTSKLDEMTLQRVALATDGKYYPARPGAAELDEILDAISGMEKSEIESKVFTNFEERYHWALIPALICLLLSSALPERRKAGAAEKHWWE